jgi:hypothetical protein
MKTIIFDDSTGNCLTIGSDNSHKNHNKVEGKKEMRKSISRLFNKTLCTALFLTSFWSIESIASEIPISNSDVFLLTDSRSISAFTSYSEIVGLPSTSTIKYKAEPTLPFSSFNGEVGRKRNSSEQSSRFIFFPETNLFIQGEGRLNTYASAGSMGSRSESTGSSIFDVKFSVFSTQNIDLSGQLFADAWSAFGGPEGKARIKLMKIDNTGKEKTIYEQSVFSTPTIDPKEGWVRNPEMKTISYDGQLSSGIYTLLVDGSTFAQGASTVWSSEAWADWDFRAQLTPVSSVPTPAALPLLSSALGMVGLSGWKKEDC